MYAYHWCWSESWSEDQPGTVDHQSRTGRTVLFLLFWFLISEVSERISTELCHIFTYDCYLKIWSELPWAFTPYRLGAKRFFGTKFELWLNISRQRNMISTIGKKLSIYRDSPTFPKIDVLWSRNGWRVFAYPLFFALGTLAALLHRYYIITPDSRQTLANWHGLCSGTSLQSITAECRAGSRWALPCI